MSSWINLKNISSVPHKKTQQTGGGPCDGRPVRWTESKQVETQTDVAPDVAGLSDEELMRIVREGGQ